MFPQYPECLRCQHDGMGDANRWKKVNPFSWETDGGHELKPHGGVCHVVLGVQAATATPERHKNVQVGPTEVK